LPMEIGIKEATATVLLTGKASTFGPIIRLTKANLNKGNGTAEGFGSLWVSSVIRMTGNS
jgi:hypothetical protein